MPRRYQTRIWQLQIPDDWKVQASRDQEFVTLYCPEGVGRLTILSLNEELYGGAKGGRSYRGGQIREPSDSVYGTSYSRAWTFFFGGCKVIVRYSCAASNKQLEREHIDAVVRSISERTDESNY